MAENIGDGSTGQNPDVEQPASFTLDEESLRAIEVECAKYPPGRQASAVIAALDAVAARLGMAPIRVYEVATFYLMFNTNFIVR